MFNEQLQKICTCSRTVQWTTQRTVHCVRKHAQTELRLELTHARILAHFHEFRQFNEIEKENSIFPLNSFILISGPFRNGRCLCIWIFLKPENGTRSMNAFYRSQKARIRPLLAPLLTANRGVHNLLVSCSCSNTDSAQCACALCLYYRL